MKKQNTIEARIKHLLTEAGKLERNIAYKNIHYDEMQSREPEGGINYYFMDELHELEEEFSHLVSLLYATTYCYLNMCGLNEYLNLFKEMFGHAYDASRALKNFTYNHSSGEPYSEYMSEFRGFLYSFEFIHQDVAEQYLKQSGVQYLERILRNTAVIIKKLEKTPSSEPQVYKSVKVVLESIFPDSKKAGSNFLKIAKEYKPDILIPELSSAIEYKYADDENKLKITIEQIAADVKGYTGDSDYKLFYAVFYVTSDFWGYERFKEIWKENEFPENWRGIYVVGPKA